MTTTNSTKKNFTIKPGYSVPFNDCFALILSVDADLVTYCKYPYHNAPVLRIQPQYMQFAIQAGVKKELSRIEWCKANGGCPEWLQQLEAWILEDAELPTTTPEDYKKFTVEVRPTEHYKAQYKETEFWYYCEQFGGCYGKEDDTVGIQGARKMDLAGMIADPCFEIVSIVAEQPRNIED